MFACLCVMACNAGCKSEPEDNKTETVFLVSTPVHKDTSLIRNYVCQIKAYQHIEVRALEKGYLERIYVDEGQTVKRGQPLFQIMPLIYQAELEKAQADAEFAKIEFQNTKNLSDSNVVSANELALAKAHYNRALAELSLARTHLQFTKISAPFDGIIDHLHARLGSLVDEGHLLTTLSDNSKLWVYFNVPEAEYLNYKRHEKKDSLMKVWLEMADHEIYEHPGVVETIEADFNNETGNIAFRATFPNPRRLLRHGETGNIRMVTRIRDATLVPQKATYEVLEKRFVFVVGNDSVVHQKEISIVASMPNLFAVAGIRPTDKILIEGIRKASEGQKIGYKFEKPERIFSQLDVYTE
jgi:membrane fusion protein, multidrug efflux system